MTRKWTALDMGKLGTRHAELEALCDLEGVLATLVPEPRYEFWPMGFQMSGGQTVRRYYEQLFAHFISRTRSYQLVAQWLDETAVVQEYALDLEVDGSIESHRILGILYAEGDRLGGERVYASEHCTRRMVGDLLDDLTPV